MLPLLLKSPLPSTSQSVDGISRSCAYEAFLTYFVILIFRTGTDTVITVKNLNQTIQWGMLRSNYLESLLRIVSGIYAPMFFKNITWPDSIKNDFTAHLHRYLSCSASLMQLKMSTG